MSEQRSIGERFRRFKVRIAVLMAMFLRGVAMGLAEVVPGVSGGTIAFVSGIYGRLIDALAGFGLKSFALIGRPAEFWRQHDMNFLFVLGLGMLAGVFTFGRIVAWMLRDYPTVLWAFFFGLISASIVIIGRERERRTLLLSAPIGVLLGIGMLHLPVGNADPALWQVFFAGAIAVCAWILPAVSGSFLLLILGYYAALIAAVEQFDLVFIIVFMAGCALGLLSFAKFLKAMLARFFEIIVSLLTGLMLGALARLWPWQVQAEGEFSFSGLQLPGAFSASTGEPSQWVGCLVAMLFGVVVLIWLSRLATGAELERGADEARG